MQSVFSFKLRGAYNKMAYLSRDLLQKGVIRCFGGKSCSGSRFGARQLGTQAIIVMPVTTPASQNRRSKSPERIVVLHGDTYDDAYTYARAVRSGKRLNFYPSLR
jgi:threonine dehydratase